MIPKAKSIEQTCVACPSQWAGWTTDNRQFYIRYRWGYLSLRFGEIGDASGLAAVGGTEAYGADIGDGLDGYMSGSAMRRHLSGHLDFSGDTQ